MKESVEVIRTDEEAAEDLRENRALSDNQSEEPNYILRTQLFVCLFIAGVIYFTWKQGGELWKNLSWTLTHILEDGLSFSGQEELTRFTDEVRDFFGNLVEAFAPIRG